MAPLQRVSTIALTTIRAIAGILIAALVVVVGGSVILRTFGVVPAGSAELATLLFVWAIYIGAFLAFLEGGHLAITVATDRLKGRALLAILILADLLVLVFALAVTFEGYKYVQLALESIRLTPSLRISPAWQYSAVVVGMALSSLYLIGNIVRNAIRIVRNEPPPRQELDDELLEGAA